MKGNQTLELKVFLGEHRENYSCVFAIFQPFLIFIPEHFPFLTFPIVSPECIVVVKGQQGFSSLELNSNVALVKRWPGLLKFIGHVSGGVGSVDAVSATEISS